MLYEVITIIGATLAGGTSNDGTLQVSYSILGNVVPIPAGEARVVELHVALTANAASASYPAFVIEQADNSFGTARVIHDA